MSSRESRAVVHGSARRRRWSKERPPNMSHVTPLRIVLLGKSVSENSGVGNFLLGRAAFDSEAPPDVVERVGGRLKDRHVMVINSPQLLQTNISDHQITQTVRECVSLSHPGPHVIVLLLKHDQCSAEDQECVEKVLDSFSERVYQHTMVLTTQEPTETNDILQKIIQKCFYRHFSLQRRSSPDDLLQTFEDIVEMNDGRHLVCAEGSQYFTMKKQATERCCGMKMEGTDVMCLNLVLLGKTRAGKSSSGNTILGRQALISKRSFRSVTQDVAVETGTVGQISVTVYDTPGLFNTDMSEQEIRQKYEEVLQRCESGLCVFLLVIKADRFTVEDRKTVEKIEELLGEKRLEKTWILFTRGDELEEENMTIKEFINETEPLKKLILKYYQRYHVFNNKAKGNIGQVQTLLIKILKPYFDIPAEEVPERLKPQRKIPKDIEPDAPADSLSSRRIVLLGRTGVGKSAAGNTILGQKEFYSVMRMSSVTRECSEAHATVSGRSVSVVDTPEFFDTKMNPEELMIEIERNVYLSSPGPHAFIIVFRVDDRFTAQDQQIPQQIEMMFGQEVLKYSIILFTHGDLLEEQTVEELIECDSRLRDLVQQCGDRFHVFNNKDLNNREQVNDLLQKIDTMIEQNGGGHYSKREVEERRRREEEERRRREEEERRRREERKQQNCVCS